MTNKPCPHKLLRKQYEEMSKEHPWYVCDGWISIEKRLPEENLSVWAWVVGDWNGIYEEPHGCEMTYAFNSRTEHLAWLWNDERDVEYQVTHWQPLPDPPCECGQKFKAQEWDGRVRIVKRAEEKANEG